MKDFVVYSKAPNSESQKPQEHFPQMRLAYDYAKKLELEGHKWIQIRDIFGTGKFHNLEDITKYKKKQ